MAQQVCVLLGIKTVRKLHCGVIYSVIFIVFGVKSFKD